MVTLVAVALAIGLAYFVGGYHARERERARIAAGDIARFEADLLRGRGRRLHPDPENAPVVTRIHFVRHR
jgi:hypothetical protein